jgi:hypothetical protein
MKNTAALLMALGLALPAITLAQDSGDGVRPLRERPARREANRDGGAPRDPASTDRRGPNGDRPMRPSHPPIPPLFAALDVNHDGVIDETEINQAADALRKLDKNGDGKLTPDELRPPRPDGPANVGPDAGKDGDSNITGPRRERGPGSEDGVRPHRGPRPPQDI